MAKFCTACGYEVSAEARFCDECGASLAAITTPPPETTPKASAVPVSGSRHRASLLRLSLGGALVVTLAFGGLYFMLREQPLPEGEALAKILNSDTGLVQAKTCLNNFEYSKSPVNLNGYDSNTRAWLDFLVEAGIYSSSGRIVDMSSFFPQEFWRYQHGEKAAEYIKDGRLCFATKLEVKGVQFQEINRSREKPFVVGSVSYDFVDRAPWSKSEEVVRRFGDKLSTPGDLDVFLRLEENSWRIRKPTASELSALKKRASAEKETASSGFMDRIFSFFQGAPETSILGKWQVDTGLVPVVIEITPGVVVIAEIEQSATFTRKGKRVQAVVGDNEKHVLSFEKVSNDEMLIFDDGRKLVAKRVM